MRLAERRTPVANALGYTGLSLVLALAFLAVARWTAAAPPLAVWGGTVWVFVLSMIISMPLTTAWGRRKKERGGGR
jgi:hypothetical protein